jgi:hypothetical protein
MKRPQRGGELGPQSREECRREPAQFQSRLCDPPIPLNSGLDTYFGQYPGIVPCAVAGRAKKI